MFVLWNEYIIDRVLEDPTQYNLLISCWSISHNAFRILTQPLYSFYRFKTIDLEPLFLFKNKHNP